MKSAQAFAYLYEGRKITHSAYDAYLMIKDGSIRLFSKEDDKERLPTSSFCIYMSHLEKDGWEIYETREEQLKKKEAAKDALEKEIKGYLSSPIGNPRDTIVESIRLLEDVLDYLEEE
jgi:hypothetical protein